MLYTRFCSVQIQASVLDVLVDFLGSLQEGILDVLSAMKRAAGVTQAGQDVEAVGYKHPAGTCLSLACKNSFWYLKQMHH